MQVSQVVPVTYCLHRHVPFWGLHCVVAMVPAASQPQDVQLREGEGGREGGRERGGGRVKWGKRTGGGMEEWNRMGTKLSRYHSGFTYFGNWKNPGRQPSHALPPTPSLVHVHCPVMVSHTLLSDPCKSQSHATHPPGVK